MKSLTPIRALIVDDHPFMRIGVAAILNTQDDLLVCGEAASVQEAVDVFDTAPRTLCCLTCGCRMGTAFKPFIACAAGSLQSRSSCLPRTRSMKTFTRLCRPGHGPPHQRHAPHGDLLAAIRKIIRGSRLLPPPVTRALSMRSPDSELSAREREALRLMVAGRSNREISEELNIKEATVKSHVSVT